jgi:hypothetical protein
MNQLFGADRSSGAPPHLVLRANGYEASLRCGRQSNETTTPLERRQTSSVTLAFPGPNSPHRAGLTAQMEPMI